MAHTAPRRKRLGLRESWEEYRARTGFSKLSWQAEGWRLLGWGGPGSGPVRTSNGICVDESLAEGEARPAAS
jgi:hypothetical protein